MTIEEIKAAVDAGKPVRWSNDGYHVTKGRDGQYLITLTFDFFISRSLLWN